MSDPKHTSVVTAPVVEIQRMHPVVERGLSANPDPATLRELLAVQREWEAGEAKKAFTRALTALKRDLPTVIERDQLVDYTGKTGLRTRYTHTSLAAVMDAVTAPLTQHGFSLSWTPSTTGQGGGVMVTVSCKLTHSEGHSEESAISAPVDTSGNKSPAQGVASTITLLSRYTALSLLGIATADMPEPVGRTEQEGSAVDANRNLRALARLTKLGKTKQQAEQHVGRSVSEWTSDDIEKLKAWVTLEASDPNDDGR